MGTGRLEAFSDGVLAIIITIMVLEIKAPHSTEWSALAALLPVFFSYVLSFIFIGIYWNNHHHMLHASREVSGGILWANSHLLFWLSLVPFTTAWMGENHFAPLTVALYGAVLFMAALAYFILAQTLLKHESNTALRQALGKKGKEILSLALYAAAMPLAFILPAASLVLYVTVALLWLIPDRRIEGVVEREK